MRPGTCLVSRASGSAAGGLGVARRPEVERASASSRAGSTGRARKTCPFRCLHFEVCWAQERLSPSSAIARTTYPGGRRPVPPRRRAQGLTSGLLWPPGALASRASLQFLTPPPRLPSPLRPLPAVVGPRPPTPLPVWPWLPRG